VASLATLLASRWAAIAGWVVSGLLIALFLLDAGMKLIPLQLVIDGHRKMGWPSDIATIRTLGAVLLIATALYTVPRTAVLGAILLTGYLGGAVAVHVHAVDPLFSHTLFGAYLGAGVWLGLWLRDARLRALTPLAN
jgi:hypothetical protein